MLVIHFTNRDHLIDDPEEIQDWINFCKEENIPYSKI